MVVSRIQSSFPVIAFFPASTASLVGFLIILLTLVIITALGIAYSPQTHPGERLKRALLFTAATCTWLATLTLVVHHGFITPSRPITILLFLAVSNLAGIALALSPIGTRLSALPLRALIGFQAFRLPLELVLHEWATEGTIPFTMTWSGSNFDVITGIAALVLSLFSNINRVAAWAFNALGFMLLLNVMRVAVMSAPLPFSWQVEPPLLLAMYLPYALIVPVCVAGALAGHIILTRALLSGKQR